MCTRAYRPHTQQICVYKKNDEEEESLIQEIQGREGVFLEQIFFPNGERMVSRSPRRFFFAHSRARYSLNQTKRRTDRGGDDFL